MTYVAEVREEYRDVIPAITHEDGTGRLQTVTQQQNPFIYELLTQFNDISEEHGVLLNTSFNVNGKPILTRISEALEILSSTQLDAVYFKGRLVFRKGDEEKYNRDLISENIKPLDDTTTLYLFATPNDPAAIRAKYIPKIEEILGAYNEQVIIVTQPEYIGAFQSVFADSATQRTVVAELNDIKPVHCCTVERLTATWLQFEEDEIVIDLDCS